MRVRALIAALMFVTPAYAQERMTTDTCTQSWMALETLMSLPQQEVDIIADDEGWCLIEDSTINVNDKTGWRVGSLRWRATEIERFSAEGLPPRSLEIIGEGIGIVARSEDPNLGYLWSVQAAQAQSGFGLIVRWDGVQNAIVVDQAYVDFSPDNRIEATARFEGINLTDAATLQTSLGTMGLRNLDVSANFAGWFEAVVAVPLGQAVLEDNGAAPEAQVADLKIQAVAILDALPDKVLAQTSRDAFGAFIGSLPHPRGRAQLQLNADPVIGAARAMPFRTLSKLPTLMDAIPDALQDVAVSVTWTPVEAGQ